MKTANKNTTATVDKSWPMLKIGGYGTHTNKFPSGKWGYVGTVPGALSNQVFATEAETEAAFVAWFKTMPLSQQREHIGDLRNDIFKMVMEAK